MSIKEPRFHGEVTEKSHKNMSRIRGKDTSIEVVLRKALWHRGFRYRKNYKGLPGRPDIVLTKYRIAIFCVSAKYCYAAHESRLHQNDRCKRFTLCLVLTVRFRSLAPWGKLFQLFI